MKGLRSFAYPALEQVGDAAPDARISEKDSRQPWERQIPRLCQAGALDGQEPCDAMEDRQLSLATLY